MSLSVSASPAPGLRTARRRPHCPCKGSTCRGPAPHDIGSRLARVERAGRDVRASAGNEVATVAAGLLGTGFECDGPASVAAAVGVMCAIVGFHEFGHFSAARALGIHVSKFSIGFGPAIWSMERDGVEYKVCAFPLGGYVRFPDDDEESPFAPDDPDLLTNRPILDRFVVTSAGIVANIVFAFAVLFGQVSTVGVPDPIYQPGVQVPMVLRGSPGEKAGVKAGDVILSVGGQAIPAGEKAAGTVVGVITSSPGVEVELGIVRQGQPLTLTVVPETTAAGGRMGVQLAANAQVQYRKTDGLGDALATAGREMARLSGAITKGLTELVVNFSSSSAQISGPIAIVAVGAEVARKDATGLWQFAALVNLNLAAVNALPLPGLDGGYMALQLTEALRGGRKLPQDVERGIMSGGLAFLTATGLFLIVRDTINLSGL